MSTKGRLLWPVLIMLVGFGLMAFMIVVEDEPGALPLLLVVIGMGWTAVTLFRSRERAK